MKTVKQSLKKVVVESTSKSLYVLAELFSTLPCTGRFHELKVPEKLRK